MHSFTVVRRWELKFPKNTFRPIFEMFASPCIIHGSYWFLSVTHRSLVIVATCTILSIFARVACLFIDQTGLNAHLGVHGKRWLLKVKEPIQNPFEIEGYFAPPPSTSRIILKCIRPLFFPAQQACFSCSPSKHYQAGFLYIPLCPLIDCSLFQIRWIT